VFLQSLNSTVEEFLISILKPAICHVDYVTVISKCVFFPGFQLQLNNKLCNTAVIDGTNQ